MVQGVRVWDIVSDRHLDEKWLRRDILHVSGSRYINLRSGRYLLTFDEASRIVEAFMGLGFTGNDIFDWNADILPRGLFKRPNNQRMTRQKNKNVIDATSTDASDLVGKSNDNE